MGIYIQGVSGKLYTESEWLEQEIANGIYVNTGNCMFVVALKNASTEVRMYNDNNVYPDLPQISSKSDLMLDYNGKGNTTELYYVYGSNLSSAAFKCKNHTFPNGKKGYLGAGGEWQAVVDNYEEINSAITKVGGTEISGSQWCSTRYRNNSSGWCCYWFYYFRSMAWSQYLATDTCAARAFAEI